MNNKINQYKNIVGPKRCPKSKELKFITLLKKDDLLTLTF